MGACNGVPSRRWLGSMSSFLYKLLGIIILLALAMPVAAQIRSAAELPLLERADRMADDEADFEEEEAYAAPAAGGAAAGGNGATGWKGSTSVWLFHSGAMMRLAMRQHSPT